MHSKMSYYLSLLKEGVLCAHDRKGITGSIIQPILAEELLYGPGDRSSEPVLK